MIVRIKINMLESTSASADVKELRQKVKKATAKLALATELGKLKRELNRINISDAQKARYKAKIKSVMDKAGITRAPFGWKYCCYHHR